MAFNNSDDFLKESRSQSALAGINPDQSELKKCVTDKELEELQAQKGLYKNGLSVINSYSGYFSNSIIILTGPDGIVLMVHKSIDLKENIGINLEEGCCLLENHAGTNAVAVSIALKDLVVVSGKDHYLKLFREWTSIAAPVFDYNNRLIGTVALWIYNENSHPHTTGLVSLMAQLIADKYWNNLFQKKLNEERLFAFNIMNNLSYGLFAINLKQKIRWVNDTACRSLNIRRTNLLSNNIEDYIPHWKSIHKTLSKGKNISDEEFIFKFNNTEENYILNAYSVINTSNKVLGYVITFRPYSRVLKMLGRYSLNSSFFTFKNILGKSSLITHAIEVAKTAARSPSTILLTGESGTGKEVFAQAIHNGSTRAKNNFVAINCSAISPTLIESELFGYEEGAFTGAIRKGKPGKFELANNGTLFLDEIGDMPHEMQAKLLRAIQEKKISRVGGTKELPIDVRIIAATNKNLKAEMEKGQFRADLFYRLNVVPIYLSSLKERKEDIPELIRFFLKQKSQLLSKPIPELDTHTMLSLQEYHWPGNVRELENIVEKIVLFGNRQNLEVLLPKNKESNENSPHPTPGFLPKSLADTEKEAIALTLENSDWNISRAANILGIGRNTLYEKIRKHGITKK